MTPLQKCHMTRGSKFSWEPQSPQWDHFSLALNASCIEQLFEVKNSTTTKMQQNRKHLKWTLKNDKYSITTPTRYTIQNKVSIQLSQSVSVCWIIGSEYFNVKFLFDIANVSRDIMLEQLNQRRSKEWVQSSNLQWICIGFHFMFATHYLKKCQDVE